MSWSSSIKYELHIELSSTNLPFSQEYPYVYKMRTKESASQVASTPYSLEIGKWKKDHVWLWHEEMYIKSAEVLATLETPKRKS